MSDELAIPKSILFMCRMNSVRSPIAEALARQILPPGTFIASAGVRAGDRDPFVDALLTESRLETSRPGARTLEELEDDYFDLIITLAPEAHHAALELTRSLAVDVEYWPTYDPTTATGTREQIMHAYRTMRDELKRRIERRFTPLKGT